MFKRLHPLFVLMVIVLLGLLAVVVLNDFYQSMMNNRPMSYSVINLFKLAVAGVLGTIAGYLAKSNVSTEGD